MNKKKKKLCKDVTKLALKGDPLSEESVNAAINEWREQRYKGAPGLTHEESVALLSKILTKANFKKKFIKNFEKILLSISTFIIVALIVGLGVGIPIAKNNAWKSSISYDIIYPEELTSIKITSIEQHNKDKNAHFYWIDGLDRISCSLNYHNNKLVMIHEEYIYEGVSISLDIINSKSIIGEYDLTINSSDNYNVINYDNLPIYYDQNDDYYRFYFSNIFNYYIVVNSNSFSFTNSILSNLTNN